MLAAPRVAFEDTAVVDMNAVQSDTQVIEGFKETQEPALITGTKGHSTYATLGDRSQFLWRISREPSAAPSCLPASRLEFRRSHTPT